MSIKLEPENIGTENLIYLEKLNRKKFKIKVITILDMVPKISQNERKTIKFY